MSACTPGYELRQLNRFLPSSGLKVSGEAAEIDPLKEGSNPLLQQKMKPRHLQMIAVGLGRAQVVRTAFC